MRCRLALTNDWVPHKLKLYICGMKNNLLKNEIFLTALFCLVMFFNFLVQVLSQTESVLESLLFSVLLVVCIYFPTVYLNKYLLTNAIKRKKYNLFIAQFVLFSFIGGAIFGGLIFLFYHLEQIGLFPVSDYFDINQSPTFFVVVLFSAGVLINLCITGARFLHEYIKSEKTVLEYQLRTLQHQVTPHFMFNVLNHIHTLMQTDVELASSLLIKYSEILRYQLYNGTKEKVKLEQDVQFMKDFIGIEEVRWEGKLTVNNTWKIEDGTQEVPALLFITFIENAFKYVSKSDFEKGYVHIHFIQEGKKLWLWVKNSKSIIPNKHNASSGLGLKNIKERLQILYYERHTIEVQETDTDYCVAVTINTAL